MSSSSGQLSPARTVFFSASSQLSPGASGSPTASDASAGSVSSAELDQLLASLQLRRTSGAGEGGASPLAGQTFNMSSDSDGEAPTSRAVEQQRQQQQGAGWGVGSGPLHAPQRPGALPSRPAAVAPAEVEVINLASSSSDSGSDSEAWSPARLTTTQRKRQVIESSSSSSSSSRSEGSSSCDEDYFPSPKGARSSSDEGSPPPHPRRALPPFFAAISPLKSIQLNSPEQRPQPRQPKAASAGAARGAGAAAGPGAPAPRSAAAKPQSREPKPPMSAAAFKRQREALTQQLYKEYNEHIFGGQLPADLEIGWNNRLSTTAGLTHYRREVPPDPAAPPRYSARVELSSKVLDALPKLERTLAHELCHVAAWLLDHTAKPPHGPAFKKWAAAAMRRLPHLDITTCHQYEIFYPYRWQCSNTECGQTYGRHSNSIDVAKKVCGECRGRLVFLGKFLADGTPAKQRAPSGFSQFVAQHFAATKAEAPEAPHSAIMQRLSAKWAAERGKPQGRRLELGGAEGSGGNSSSGVTSLLGHLQV